MRHGHRDRLQDDRGFTIIETLVAAVLLLGGVIGSLTMLSVANDRTLVNQGREAGTNLARDVVEAANALPYEKLTGATITDALQATPGLGSAGGSWTVLRRGLRYTITSTACTIDDGVDGYGASFVKSAGGWCSDSAATNNNLMTQDRAPDDMRRVSVTVTWTQKGQVRTVTQAAVIPNPGNAGGPQVTNLTYSPGVIGPNTVVTFTATVPSSTASIVRFFVDGAQMGAGTKSGTQWSWSWDTTGLPDATSTITAQAYDVEGRSRGAFPAIVKIDRNPALAPSGFAGGRNLRLMASGSNSVVDMEWNQSDDPDVFGYRVYRGSATSRVLVCEKLREQDADPTQCTDTAPPASSPISYGVVSLDRDPVSGATRETVDPVFVPFGTDDDVPGTPGGLTATKTAEGSVVLNWTAANPGNQGEPLRFYRIYRDGVALANRYSRTQGTGQTWTDPVPSTSTHTYYVTAVDTLFGESAPTPGVTK